jgi:N-acyl amino acid synthase of PEP-CTERM/exosortase system
LRTFPVIAVACFLAGFAASELIGQTNLFAMMEPFLPRMLKRSGITIQSAGEPIDYHGIRAPYFTTKDQALEKLSPDLRYLYDSILADFKRSNSGAQEPSTRSSGIAPAATFPTYAYS